MSKPTPCLCNADNERYAAFASTPTALGQDLLNATVSAFAWTIDTFVDVLRKDVSYDAADALASFDTPQQRLTHFLFLNNPRQPADEPCALAKHVLNVALYSTADAAWDALASSYCVPRKTDLTLPLWYR